MHNDNELHSALHWSRCRFLRVVGTSVAAVPLFSACSGAPTAPTPGPEPGYYGTCVSDGVVVYGTGYIYDPWIGMYYYPPPLTYGYGACVAYTPWTGWYFGFGFGWAWGAATVGWGWGAYPYWGPYAWASQGAYVGPYGGAAVWGPGGWAGTTGNVYHRWGSTTAVTRQTAGFNAWTGNA